MRTKIKLALLSAATMLAGIGAFAQPAPGDDSSPQPPPQGQPHAGRPDPEAHKKMLLEKYDANKDGNLDDAEYTAIGKDFAEGKIGPRPGQGPGQNAFRGPDFQRHEGGEPGISGPPQDRGNFPPPFSPGGRQFAQNRPPGPARFDSPSENPPRPRRGEGEPERAGKPFGPQMPNPGRGFAPNRQAEHQPMLPLQGERLEAFKQELLKKYDGNKDGKLSDKERTAIGKDIEEGKLPPPVPRGPEFQPRPE